MGVIEVFPEAIFLEKGSRTVVGAASVVAALSDGSDASYVRAAGTSTQTWGCYVVMGDPLPSLPSGAAVERVQIKLRHSHWSRNPNAIGSEIIAPTSILVGKPPPGVSNHRMDLFTIGETYAGFSSATSPVERIQPFKNKSFDGKLWIGERLQYRQGQRLYLSINVIRGTKPYYGPNNARLYGVSLLVHYNERPTANIIEPTGTVVVARPRIEWEFQDPEGGPAQQVFDVRIYPLAVANDPNFKLSDELRYRPVYRRILHSPNPFHQVDDRPIRTQPRAGLLPIDIGKGGFGRTGESFAAFLRVKNGDIWQPGVNYRQIPLVVDPVSADYDNYAPLSTWDRSDFTLSFAQPVIPDISAAYDPDLHAIAVAVNGGDNLLPWDASSFETGTTANWVAGTNTTLAFTGVQSFHGANSLQMTRTTSTGDATASSPEFPVTPGELYTALARFRANATGRVCRVTLFFADADGNLVGTSSAANEHSVTDVNNGWRLSSVTAIAPATAATAVILVLVTGAATSEVHYLDAVGIFTKRRTTLLTENQASLETNTTGWAAGASTAITRSTVHSYHGVASLRLNRSSGTGTAQASTPSGTNGLVVLPNRLYAVSSRFLANSTLRSVRIGVQFYTAAGATVGSLTFGTQVAETAGTWVEATHSVTSPATAAFAAIFVEALAVAPTTEFHHVDAIGMWPDSTGEIMPWTAGGFVNEDAEIVLQRSMDAGTTWAQLDEDEVVYDPVTQILLFTDYEVPSAGSVTFRAKVEAPNQDGDVMNSDWSREVTVAMPAFTSWYLRDLGVAPPVTLKVHMASVSLSTPKPNTYDYAVGSDAGVMTHDGVKADNLVCSAFLLNEDDYAVWRSLVDSGHTLLLQDVHGRQWYVQPDDGTEYEVLRSVKMSTEPWPTRHAHRVDIQFLSVEPPQRVLSSA